MERERVEAIAQWPLPRSVRDIQVFLGFTGFYRRFIRNYSKTATPLTDLLKGDTKGPIHLGLGARAAFKSLILAFTTAPLLRHYDPDLPTRVETDASKFAIGAILVQRHGDRWHPVAFRSRKLSPTETRYGTGDGELLGIVDCVRAWRHYLAYTKEPVTVLTDHQNLQYWETKKKLNARQLRWLDDLSAFDLRIVFRPGAKNPADGLSRRPDWDNGDAEEAAGETLARILGAKTAATRASRIRLASVRITEGRSLVGVGACCRHTHSPVCDSLKATARERLTQTQCVRSEDASSSKATLEEHLPRTKCVRDEGIRPKATARERLTQTQCVRGEEAGCKPLSLEWLPGIGATITAPEAAAESMTDLIRHLQRGDAFVANNEWSKRRTRRSNAGSELWQLGADELLRFKGRVYVPQDTVVRKALLSEYHDAPTAGHMGVTKTLKLLKRCYYWDSLPRDVKDYVNTCAICQRTKARTHRPYGLLQALPVPSRPWQEISMDFVTGLPPAVDPLTRKVTDSILVIVDRFTKYALYIAAPKQLTASGLAELLLYHVFRHYGLPDGIISDRGSLFTSNFWTDLCYHLAVKRRLSTAFHPQTDGQTERQNQSLEHYLRAFCDYNQADWAQRLILAQYAYNNSWHSATQATPAYLLYGFHPRGPPDPPEPHQAKTPAATERAEELSRLRKATEQLLTRANAEYKKWYDQGRTHKTFVEKEWVLLSARNLQQLRPSRKIADKYLGPFQIKRVVGDHKLAYELDLPSRLRIHNVFPITALEPYNSRGDPAQEQREIAVQEDEHWEVEAILDHRGPPYNRSFLIRWKGYDSAEDSWEPRRMIDDGPLIRQYESNIHGR